MEKEKNIKIIKKIKNLIYYSFFKLINWNKSKLQKIKKGKSLNFNKNNEQTLFNIEKESMLNFIFFIFYFLFIL